MQLRARTKIVATLGPASREPAMLAELINAGVDVFRVNMAHGKRPEHEQVVQDIRAVSKQLNRPVAILVDLAGPKMRLGDLPQKEVICHLGAQFKLIRGDQVNSPDELTSTYQPLVDELEVGDRVMMADGTVGMQVIEKGADHAVLKVFQPGTVLSRQGINLPGVNLSVRAMSDEDLDNARWAARSGVDYISLSFVRRPADITELREVIRAEGADCQIIAKIEKQEALDALEGIVEETDGVMVARGDLGVETDVAKMPIEQKRIINLCNERQKPVIVATQMLDSMRNSRTPTRAEVTDVANAILDGCDACMLSAETAMGQFPKETVEMMNRIALRTEPLLKERGPRQMSDVPQEGLHRTTQAVVFGVQFVAKQLNAHLIAVTTRTGATALCLSKLRSIVPVVGISDSESTLRRLCLYWGVIPLPGIGIHEPSNLIAAIEQWGRSDGSLSAGDRVIFVGGSMLGIANAGHNMMLVHEVA